MTDYHIKSISAGDACCIDSTNQNTSKKINQKIQLENRTCKIHLLKMELQQMFPKVIHVSAINILEVTSAVSFKKNTLPCIKKMYYKNTAQI